MAEKYIREEVMAAMASDAEAKPADVSRPEFVVLDSNVIIADYWLRSTSVVLLYDFLKKTGAKLVVPQIVVEEVINHHREDLEKVKADMKKAHRQSARLLRNVSALSGQVVALNKFNTRDPYPKFISGELKRVGAQVIDYDNIPHKDIVARDLKRTRPFQQSGTGYRDALVWETIIRHCVKKGAVTVFVTDNVKDFCNPKGELHEDLRKDIQAKGADEKDFKVFQDLIQFADALVVPYLKTKKDFATLIINKKVPGLDLEEVCEVNRDAITQAIDLSPGSMIENPGKYEPTVSDIAIPKEFKIITASELSKDILLVAFEVRVVVSFFYFLPDSEYATMAEEEAAQISILDSDWNEWGVMRVEGFREIDLKCRLTFNTANEEVETFEVDEAKGVEKEY
jgi:PIN domain-containing protein